MKRTYIIIFLIAISVLTTLTVLGLNQLATGGEYIKTSNRFYWLSGTITFLNFAFTTILLVMAHFIVYRKSLEGKSIYLLLALPYLLFAIFSILNYGYVYELYNVFQQRNAQPIDTPDMENYAVNISLLAFMLCGINLGVIWGVKKV